MHLKWTRPAIKDLRDAGDFIALDNPTAADRMADRVKEAVEYLIQYPNIGRIGRVQGTRELIISGAPFIVVYRIKTPAIEILRVLHHARKWPAV
ncbi:MAG: type II toxin-antitoxin system RelE/ParE family toxin [Nitrospirae bacterium]|nr:type II toxin-antitoxin system RelE/ParE family toxin [Nitrospirota bacterium]MDA8337981.1 type II toxin-antitoxin system RelE/ParE family toxin [Nitrospiraceae bacterium]